MASIGDCLDAMISAGRISDEQAGDIVERVEKYEKQFSADMGPAQARAAAEDAALSAAEADIRLRRRQKALQTIAIDRNVKLMLSHPKGPATGLTTLLARDLTGYATWRNADARANSIRGWAHGMFFDGLDKMRTKMGGFYRDKELVNNVVREIFGESTGNADAKIAADQFREMTEMLRQRFNNAGGAIGKLDNWFPQSHDGRKVRDVMRRYRKQGMKESEAWEATKREWKDYIRPRLDREKMLDSAGGRLSEEELERVLDSSFETIVSDGLAKMTPGQSGGKKLANLHQDHRVLHFKNADSWMEYDQQFGKGDVFTAIADHIQMMSQQIGLLETMGPNPRATFRYLTDVARQQRASPDKLRTAQAVYDTVAGPSNQDISNWFGEAMQGVRNLITAAKLGSAALSQISDQAFIRQTARWNGLSQTKLLRRQLRQLSSAEDRKFAVQIGLTADMFIHHALGANRWTEVTGNGFTAKAAEATMRLSGINAITSASQKAFGLEFLANLGRAADENAWADLPTRFREALERYGFTEREWGIIQSTERVDWQGERFFDPMAIMRREDLPRRERVELGTRIQDMIHQETNFAIPMPDARTRAIMTGGLPRGTVLGEGLRSLFAIKGFTTSVVLSHGLRGFYQNSWGNVAKYWGGLSVMTTLMGMLAMQAKEIARGRDPRDMDRADTWAAAFMQGGGAGIFGDFVFSDQSRFGRGIASTMAGPVFGLAQDTYDVTIGNIHALARGDDPEILASLFRFGGNYTPGGSLWYGRLLYERAVLDQLQEWSDPQGTRKRQRRMERRRRREYGQQYWWRPGEMSPRRAPEAPALPDIEEMTQ